MSKRMLVLLLSVASIAAACGGDSDTDREPASSATTADSSQPTIPQAEADPSDAYFELDRVLNISIELASEDWDTLRNQTRTLEDVLAEIEEYQLSQPFASIYTWFSGTVTVDGETHFEVGVRKKGFVGSQSDTKPSLKLRFDKFVDDQSLGGAMKRMTLNNSKQDPSMLNTCLAYRIFNQVGNPAPRCNFAKVAVNGKDLGLYVHVEELKKPFLERHFKSKKGNLYEGTVSDFTATHRGTIEKKTNEDEADWSDIAAVVAALQDQSDAAIAALDEIVDLERFLTFWATEVLIGHWDGYAGNRNNYQFYREPDGRFVFIPWGPDDSFHLKDDPNIFDNISNPPPSVLALGAIPNRLYNDPRWRDAYINRLKQLLDEVWDEDELLAVVDDMATVVRNHTTGDARDAALEDSERVRKFILKRRGEILADITPRAPEWPKEDDSSERGALGGAALSGTLEVAFETIWGSKYIPNPEDEGKITRLLLDDSEEPLENLLVTVGEASADEKTLLPNAAETAAIVAARVEADGSLNGLVIVVDLAQWVAGATLTIGTDAIAGGTWSIPRGGQTPDSFTSFTEGTLTLSSAGTTHGANVAGHFSGTYGSPSAN